MRWFALDEWFWESRLSTLELNERLAARASALRFGSAIRTRDFVGSVSETGFHLTPVVWGQSSLLPQFVGEWRPTPTGSDVRVVVVANRVIQVCLVILFAFLSTLIYDAQFERVAIVTLGGALLGWLWLQGSYLIGSGLAERKLRRLLDATPITTAKPWSLIEPRPTGVQSTIQLGTIIAVSTGIGLLWLIYHGSFAFTVRPAVDLVYTYWATQAVAITWLFCLSRTRPNSVMRSLVVLFTLEVTAAWLLTVDGYAGDGRPLVTWRWLPRLKGERLAIKSVQSVATNVSVDLSITGPHDFASFRGARRDGIVYGIRLNPAWQQSPPKIIWRQPIGLGWSSFAIVSDFAVTQEQQGPDEVVVCYELATGRPCWEHRDRTLFHEMMGGDGPRATPTISSGLVYTLGATGVLNCLNGRDGRRVWSVNVIKDNAAPTSLFGMAGSPLVWNDLVIVAPGAPGASLVAYDRQDGRRVWQAGSAAAAYASPQLATFGGIEHILCFNAEGLFAHTPDGGAILWSIPWVTPPERNNVCQPIVWRDEQKHETVWISSGYGKGCGLLKIGINGKSFIVTPHWKNLKLQAKFASAVERGCYVYGLDNNILCCIDLRTGRQCWKGGRYGFGQLLLVDRHLLIVTDQGEIVLCDATPDGHHEVARFPVLEGRTWTHPALSGNRLLIRNDRLAACVELPL